jgi:hypothetical protein
LSFFPIEVLYGIEYLIVTDRVSNGNRLARPVIYIGWLMQSVLTTKKSIACRAVMNSIFAGIHQERYETQEESKEEQSKTH